MKPVVVIQLIHWLRRGDPRLRDMTLFEFFCMAYRHQYKGRNEQAVGQDLALFAQTGQVPFYVQQYIRKQVYPLLTHGNAYPKPKLLV